MAILSSPVASDSTEAQLRAQGTVSGVVSMKLKKGMIGRWLEKGTRQSAHITASIMYTHLSLGRAAFQIASPLGLSLETDLSCL